MWSGDSWSDYRFKRLPYHRSCPEIRRNSDYVIVYMICIRLCVVRKARILEPFLYMMESIFSNQKRFAFAVLSSESFNGRTLFSRDICKSYNYIWVTKFSTYIESMFAMFNPCKIKCVYELKCEARYLIFFSFIAQSTNWRRIFKQREITLIK
jgi:hypothetical protein